MKTTTPAMLSLCMATLLGAAPVARADAISIDISGGTQWRTTEDWTLGTQWAIGNFQATDGVAAWAPYGNAATQLNPNRMMWNCGADGALCPGGGNGGAGPTEVYFGYAFDIAPGASFSGAAALIADDFFDLVINGQEVLAATLDGNFNGNGQPQPLTVDLTPFLRWGHNVLAIRAMDGYLEDAASCAARGAGYQTVYSNLGEFCKGNRANEYMFLSGSVVVVPEPTTWSMVGLALAGLMLARWRVPVPKS